MSATITRIRSVLEVMSNIAVPIAERAGGANADAIADAPV
jgi:hypothetical protein